MNKRKIKITVSDLMPFVILILMAAIFGVTTRGSIFAGSNLMNLFNQSIATLVCALGMVFVSAMGGTDITVGSLLAMASVIAFKSIQGTSWLLFIPVALLVGLLSGLLLGIINAKFKVPSFMASLALLIAYRAYVNLSLKSVSYTLPPQLKFFRNELFDLISVLVLIIIVIYVFHYTPFGVYVRGVGENENAMKHAGVNVDRVKIIAFMISGFMAALAGIYLTARVGGVNNTLGSGFEMKVMMAMFIGGIPVEGGTGSKIFKLVIGAPTITLLENGLVLSGFDGAATQLVRGIVLLVVIYVTMFVNEKFRYGIRRKTAEA